MTAVIIKILILGTVRLEMKALPSKSATDSCAD